MNYIISIIITNQLVRSQARGLHKAASIPKNPVSDMPRQMDKADMEYMLQVAAFFF